MINRKDLLPLPKNFIKVGFPTIHPLYDIHGKLLLQSGVMVESEAQLEKLYELGRYQDLQSSGKIKSTQDSGGKATMGQDGQKLEENQHQEEMLVELPFNRLKLGESLQISPLSEKVGSVKYFIKFLGGINKKSLIFTLPLIDNKVMFVKENAGFSVLMFSGKGVYRFNTMVDVVYSRPFPHMHLKFPREVYLKVLRKNQRVPVNIIVSLMNKSVNEYENTKIAGRIIDLSLGGILVETNKKNANVDDVLECTFKINFEGGELVLVIDGVLRSISSPDQPEGRVINSYGIQFTQLPFKNKIILQSYIFQLLTGEKLDEL